MAETVKFQNHQHVLPPQSPDKPSLSLRVWPPSQRTRDVVIKHLIDTFSSPSPLINRYGTISPDEAEANAKIIEEESFNAAEGLNEGEEDDPSRGIEILQLYSKEISKRMLETVKTKAGFMKPDSEN
ncbi:WPP domain protein 1 [Euphorbia peplus]|nr:WPP domain protein 1 [Euphorbia peplus]